MSQDDKTGEAIPTPLTDAFAVALDKKLWAEIPTLMAPAITKALQSYTNFARELEASRSASALAKEARELLEKWDAVSQFAFDAQADPDMGLSKAVEINQQAAEVTERCKALLRSLAIAPASAERDSIRDGEAGVTPGRSAAGPAPLDQMTVEDRITAEALTHFEARWPGLSAPSSELARLREFQRKIEEAEARCCPEDVGFEEWIGVLKRQVGERDVQIGTLTAAINAMNQAPNSATSPSKDEARLLWLEKVLQHCPHAELTHNDDAEEGPVGWSLAIESCSRMDLQAPTLAALIDLGMNTEPDEDGDVVARSEGRDA